MGLLRTIVVAALVAIASGLPGAASATLVDDCCGEACDGDRGGAQCPPDCTNGACAKVFPSALAPRRVDHLAAAPGGEERPAPTVAPALPLVVGGVFHPPRR